MTACTKVYVTVCVNNAACSVGVI